MNEAFFVVLRVSSWLIPRLPRVVSYALAATSGKLAFMVLQGTRASLCANLAHVLERPSNSRQVRRAAVRAFENDAKNWVDTLRIPHMSDDDVLAAVDLQGWSHLEQAASEGKGIVLVGLHLGNFDLVGQVLAIRGFKVTIPVERMHPERLFRFLTSLRTGRGIRAIPTDRAPREMVRALRGGEIVAVVGDRNLVGRGKRIRFFGSDAMLPRSPASLARHAGAPLLLGVGVRLPSDRFTGIVVPVLAAGEATTMSEGEILTKLAGEMEALIRRFADQWIVFSPVWDDGDSPKHPDTIEHLGSGSDVMSGSRR